MVNEGTAASNPEEFAAQRVVVVAESGEFEITLCGILVDTEIYGIYGAEFCKCRWLELDCWVH